MTSKLTAPDFERFARTPCPIASLASSGMSALSSLFARSWSRKAPRVLRNSAANSAQELEELMSTMRIASIRGRGGSALMRWGASPDWTHRQNFFSADTRTVKYSGSMGILISTHLPPPVMIDSAAVRERVTHMLCGQHEFGFEYRSSRLHKPIQGRLHPWDCGVLHAALDLCNLLTCVALVLESIP